MTIALVGPPMSGKTTLFNHMTGENADIGNRPGVTVDTLVGKSIFERGVEITDLPGIYSLNSYTEDERAANRYINSGVADRCICVLDAMNPERGVVLALCLSRYGIPLVLAVNMYDILTKRGGRVDLKAVDAYRHALRCGILAYKFRNKELFAAAKSARPRAKRCGAIQQRKYFCSESIVKECFDFGSGRGKLTVFLDSFRQAPLSFLIFASVLATVFYLSFGAPGRSRQRFWRFKRHFSAQNNSCPARGCPLFSPGCFATGF